jgi:hypothetical protein
MTKEDLINEHYLLGSCDVSLEQHATVSIEYALNVLLEINKSNTAQGTLTMLSAKINELKALIV